MWLEEMKYFLPECIASKQLCGTLSKLPIYSNDINFTGTLSDQSTNTESERLSCVKYNNFGTKLLEPNQRFPHLFALPVSHNWSWFLQQPKVHA